MNEGVPPAVVNYERKLRLGACGPLAASKIRYQVANYEAAYVLMQQTVQQGRLILCDAGIPSVTFPYYHNFTRELFKLTRKYQLSEVPFEATRAEAARIAEKWTLRGLDKALLEQIGLVVFNLQWSDPPAGPVA